MMLVTIENVPTWALCYFANGEWGEQTEEEKRKIEQWVADYLPHGFTCDFEQDKDSNLIEFFTDFPLCGLATNCVRTAFYSDIEPEPLSGSMANAYRHHVMNSLWDIFEADFQPGEGADYYANYSPEAMELLRLDDELANLSCAGLGTSNHTFAVKLRRFCELTKLWDDRMTWDAKVHRTAISLRTPNI